MNAKQYAAHVAGLAAARDLSAMTEADLAFYLETAFIAGVNHAASRFMEDSAGLRIEEVEEGAFDDISRSMEEFTKQILFACGIPPNRLKKM